MSTESLQVCRRCRRPIAMAVAWLWLALVPAVKAFGQAASATVSGTVVDETGAVMPDVEITATQSSTGLQRHLRASAEGAFTIPLLPPGIYNITAQRDGFAPAVVRDLSLNVGDELLLTIRMKVAGLGDTVTVIAEPPKVSTSPAVGIALDQRFVESMPLSGRSFDGLILLAPGVVPSAGFGDFSANGQRTMTNYFTIDGVSANIGARPSANGMGQEASGAMPGLSVTGGTNTLLSLEAFREVRILTSTFAPEFGRSPGAQVSIVTRSGTNELSGSLFEYYRTSALDATDWFVNNRGGAKPDYDYHNFGGVVGGPLVRRRAFLFGSYEGQRLEQPAFGVTGVPSAPTRSAAPADLRPYLDSYPVPNGPELGNGLAEFSASFIQPSDLDAASARADVVIGSRQTFFTRVSTGRSKIKLRGGRTATNALSYVQSERTETLTATSGSTSILSQSLVNDLRVNYSRHRARVSADVDSFGGAIPLFPRDMIHPSATAADSDIEYDLFRGIGARIAQGVLAGVQQEQVNIVNTLSYSHGRHEFKFGVDYRRLAPEQQSAERKYVYGFDQVADLLEHRASRVTVDRLAPARAAFDNFSGFAQDNWRVSSRLSATYGFRYDVNPPPRSLNDLEPLLVNNGDVAGGAVFVPTGHPLWNTSWTNIGPRVGAAYRLSEEVDRETVLRGGWGLFFDQGSGRAGNAFGGGYPYKDRRQYTLVAFPLVPDQLTAPMGAPTTPGANEVFSFPADLRTPNVQHWNVTIERAFGVHQSISAGYVGAIGRDLLDWRAYKYPATQNVQLVNYQSNSGTSDYHALQLHYRRRLTNGVQGLASYTWSRSIDTDSGELASTLPPFEKVDPQLDRGPSDFDLRHVLRIALSYQPTIATSNPVLRALVNNWQIDLLGSFSSGAPFNVNVFQDVGFGFFTLRADLVPGQPVWLDDSSVPGGRRLNRAAFQAPRGVQGTLGRNTLRTPPFSQIDLAVSRSMRLVGPFRLQLRLEAFNVLNQPAFAPQTITLTSPLFGVPTQTLASSLGPGSVSDGSSNPLHARGGPRAIQLSSRIRF